MTGVSAYPESTLVERALTLLADGPQSATVLATDVFGLTRAPEAIAARLAVALLGADPRVRQLPDGTWGLATGGMGSPALEDCAFAVVDVETTGQGRVRNDRVTEVAVAVVHGERLELVLDTLVNPEAPIHPMATAITRITNAMVKHAPTFDEVADHVLRELAGRVFVAHNARFDWNALGAELRRSRDVLLTGPLLCTVRLSRRLIPGIESCSLDSVSHYFGIENTARHRAGGDALATATLLYRLLQRAHESGVRSLRELEALAERPMPGKRRRPRPRGSRGNRRRPGRPDSGGTA